MSAEALHGLRRARAARRWQGIDFFEAWYRVYMAGFAVFVTALILSKIIGDGRLEPGVVTQVARTGPALAGLGIALSVAAGIRSGLHGGPLTVERADVRHVLMAPVPRAAALRRPTVRFLARLFAGASATGAIAGSLAAERNGGRVWPWVFSVLVVSGVAALLSASSAFVVSGLRLGRAAGNVAMLAVVGTALAGAALGLRGSVWTALGSAALSPLTGAAVLWTIAVGAAAVAAGVAAAPGLSLESAERRSRVVGGIQVAASTHDIRTVLLLHRQLAQEQPRPRRLLPLPARLPRTLLGACWRRGWAGLNRWPLSRWARDLVLAAVAGLAAVFTARGTTPAVAVAGLAAFALAVDVCEALGQERDHPDLEDAMPVRIGLLRLRHLLVPAVVVTALVGAGLQLGRVVLRSQSLAAVAALPGVMLTSLGAAALALVLAPPDPMAHGLTPDFAAANALLRAVRMPLLATAGFVPFVVQPRAGVAAAALAGIVTAVLGAAAIVAAGFVAAAQRTLARVPGPRDHSHDGRVVRDHRTALETFALSKSYFDTPALAPVSLRVSAGELVALVGSNGAGKSTLLRLIAGLLDPSSGRALVCGHRAGSLEARKALAYVGDEPVLYDDLSVDEHIGYLGAIFGSSDASSKLVERFRLGGRRGDLPSRLSRGLRQKTSLVLALMRQTDVLLVDEPFVGLDPGAQRELTEILAEGAARGQAVVVATHQLPLLERATRCVVMREGGVVYDGPAGRAPLSEMLG